MVSFSISSIFQKFRESSHSESYPIGTVVKFPKEEGKVYAVVIPSDEFRASQSYKYAYAPKKSSIDKGEEVCLRTASGLYISMPTSALRRIDNLEEELKLLEQSRSELENSLELKLSKSTEMLLFGLDMNISFLEKAVSSYKN